MATLNLSLTVPDGMVVSLGHALADWLGVAAPTTNAQRVAIAEAFLKANAKIVHRDWKGQEARETAMADDSDGSVSW